MRETARRAKDMAAERVRAFPTETNSPAISIDDNIPSLLDFSDEDIDVMLRNQN